MELVGDASAIIAALTDDGPDGAWATEQLLGAAISAPTIVHYECANVFRRRELAGALAPALAAQAHADLVQLPMRLWPYRGVATRAWELRGNVTSYDASYVALAELLDVPLLTLDRRLAHAPGLRCEIRTP